MLLHVIRQVPQAAIDFVKAHEGLKLVASADLAGNMDAGYGHDDRSLRPGQQITQEQADVWLAQDLLTAATRLEEAVGEACIAELTDNQYAAMISFTYNVGIDPKWRICQLLRTQQFDQIPAELMRFVNAGGKKVQGLVNRRADEVKLWSTDEPGSIPTQPSSSTTRAIDTPPTDSASSLTPLHKLPAFVGSCVTAVCTTGASFAPQIKRGVDGINGAISPYVGQSSVLQALSSHLALAGAVAASATLVFAWLQHRKAQSL